MIPVQGPRPLEAVRLLCFGQTDHYFFEVKTKFHFYTKQVINKSASVIFEFVKLIILSYIIDRKGISKGARLSAAHVHAQFIVMLTTCK